MGDNGNERQRLCGGLFGCGGDQASEYMVESNAVDAALTPRTRDRLNRMDELNQEALEPYVASYRVSRRRVVGAGGLLGLLATLAPTSLLTACSALRAGGMGATSGGRTHVVESNAETVRLGVFDATRPNVVEIDPGDTVVYPTPGRISSTGSSEASPSSSLPSGAWRIRARDRTRSSGRSASRAPNPATCWPSGS